MSKYTVRLSRTFLVTAHGVEADTPAEAYELAWEYFNDGKVAFDDIVDKNVTVESENDINEQL